MELEEIWAKGTSKKVNGGDLLFNICHGRAKYFWPWCCLKRHGTEIYIFVFSVHCFKEIFEFISNLFLPE